MCSSCSKKRRLAVNAVGKTDPTKTLTLRNQFSRQMRSRINKLMKDVRISIVENDAFGFAIDISRAVDYIALQAAERNKFYFTRSSERVEAFMEWLEDQQRQGILEIIIRPGTVQGIHQQWTDTYIQSAYARGIFRARAELGKAGYEIAPVGDTEGGIAYFMNQPFHVDRVGALYTRTFEDLRTVMSQTNAQMRRKLLDFLTDRLPRGIAQGKNPNQIGRELYKDLAQTMIDVSKKRAVMIARTEVIRAHHVANIAEFRRADAEMTVQVQAEWLTAGDSRVCPICAGFSGKVFTLDEAAGMLPAHPNCRCVVIPVMKKRKSSKAA